MNEAKFTLTPQNARGVMRSIWDNLNGWFENGNLDITSAHTNPNAVSSKTAAFGKFTGN